LGAQTTTNKLFIKIKLKVLIIMGSDCVASKKLLELMNKGIAREIGVAIQYMWQHILVSGIKSLVVEGIFKEIAIVEMKHAEDIAERLAYLGGIPTIKPDPIFVGSNLEEMLKLDEKAEEEAILLYKTTIKVANEEDDVTTRRLFEDILVAEEEHIDTFSKLLVGMIPLSDPEI
jgi:bacterioferritin